MNVMQHLLVHLLYEAKVGGPIQCRWMYFIERDLKKPKQPSEIKHEWRDELPRHSILRRSHTTRAHILQKKITLMLIYRATTPRMRHRRAISSCFSGLARTSMLVWSMKCAYKNGILHCCICTQIWRRWKNISCKYHDIYLICESRLAMYLC
jgi:hypothetical protein